MTSSKTLANLRALQTLREQRSKADHATTVRAERSAREEAEEAKAKLTAQNHALDDYAAQDELQIERFQIFAQLIMQSEAEVIARRETHKEAGDQEAEARRKRLRAEKQSEQLTKLHNKALSKERSKAEDRKAIEFLSQAAISKRART